MRGKRNLLGSGVGLDAGIDDKLLDEGAHDDDPMASMGNLMDVMLVFACGLLLALVVRWNVDVNDYGNTSLPEGAQAVEGEVEEAPGDAVDAGDESLSELGTAYRDEETGQIYIVG